MSAVNEAARPRSRRGWLRCVPGSLRPVMPRAGPSGEVTLIAVTKTYPGLRHPAARASSACADIGENRDQEAAPKAAECAALGVPVTWHFVGQLQTNKAASVVSYASVIHSVDRLRLVGALGSRARASGPHRDLPGPGEPRRRPARGGASGRRSPRLPTR